MTLSGSQPTNATPPHRPTTLTYATYFDKVLGGWIGKCAGGILGAPIEGIKRFNTIELSDQLFETNFPNDDLDLQVLWLDLVKKNGPILRESDLARHWVRHVNFPWNEYGVATRNFRLGLYPPQSGRHNNDYWKESMGCPIRSEIWGMLNPGDPERAMHYARMDACLDHSGFSVEAEQFLSACAALAFVESDIAIIFTEASQYLVPGSTMHRLITSVTNWYRASGYEVAMGKVKSYWGDADFTSAPMNVGFTLLALLHKGTDFSCVLDALHLGHDSDCISATAGALVGIIYGYRAVSDLWKRRVGNELLLSAEITGLDVPNTITGLAEETCRAGRSFIEHYNVFQLAGEWPEPYAVQPSRFSVQLTNEAAGTLQLAYENLEATPQEVSLTVRAGVAAEVVHTATLAVASNATEVLTFAVPSVAQPDLADTYLVDVVIDGQAVGTLTRGFPHYGSWLLLGPFIEDDPALAPAPDPRFPDHGLSSLPSARYMNHDRINRDTDFLTLEQVRTIARDRTDDTYPFGVAVVKPTDFSIDLPQYYHGKGERTVYLYSKLSFTEATQLWVSMGCTALFTLWINGESVHVQNEVRRTWPGQTTVLYAFQPGDNDILLKIDTVTDEPRLEIGFKEFIGRHPHQSQWALVVPTL
jgi:ADP-ribosylglycohydrolase